MKKISRAFLMLFFAFIVIGIIAILGLIDFFILKKLGLEYTSIVTLAVMYVAFVVIEFPLGTFAKALPFIISTNIALSKHSISIIQFVIGFVFNTVIILFLDMLFSSVQLSNKSAIALAISEILFEHLFMYIGSKINMSNATKNTID